MQQSIWKIRTRRPSYEVSPQYGLAPWNHLLGVLLKRRGERSNSTLSPTAAPRRRLPALTVARSNGATVAVRSSASFIHDTAAPKLANCTRLQTEPAASCPTVASCPASHTWHHTLHREAPPAVVPARPGQTSPRLLDARSGGRGRTWLCSVRPGLLKKAGHNVGLRKKLATQGGTAGGGSRSHSFVVITVCRYVPLGSLRSYVMRGPALASSAAQRNCQPGSFEEGYYWTVHMVLVGSVCGYGRAATRQRSLRA
ncbi:hypothetical protein CALCODRAFT_332226 [Calocera cornea HHB12733]|uniref:Uncharacterized protein n=1 Tax=Calocera cornea HHB12733 TaxID=1353952 RepID=A0A165F1C8_9BASI|nr:hypothetical protein CALCODRAFT_332226 [Calocera cornea HHB12733]